MSRATFTKQLAADVAPAGTFTLSYFGGLEQTDFTDPQTVIVEVYAREFECAISFGASEATITWPAGAPYDLPAGEYYIDVDLVGGDELPADVSQAENQADSTAADVAGIVADHNALLAKLKAAGLMAPDA